MFHRVWQREQSGRDIPCVAVAGFFLQFPGRGIGRYSSLVIEHLCRMDGIDPLVLLAEREDLGRIAVPSGRVPRAVLVPQPFRGLKRRLSPKAYAARSSSG